MKKKNVRPKRIDEYYHPERQNEEIDKIICARCMKVIKKTELNNQFKINIGSFVKGNFISSKTSVFYHRECLKE